MFINQKGFSKKKNDKLLNSLQIAPIKKKSKKRKKKVPPKKKNTISKEDEMQNTKNPNRHLIKIHKMNANNQTIRWTNKKNQEAIDIFIKMKSFHIMK